MHIKDLINILHKGNHTLVVYSDTVYTFNNRGVSDLYAILQNTPDILKGAAVADKVVGKGAAAMMLLGGVRQLHADIISEPALKLFDTSSVIVTFDRKVPYIINRKGDGMCPVETLCMSADTPRQCLKQIQAFFKTS